MQVNNISRFIESHKVRRAPKFVEPPLLTVETVEKDGVFVNQLVEKKYDAKNDERNHFVASDFSLSTVLANDGYKSLKECRLSSSVMDNVDRIDGVCENIASLAESQRSLQETSVENNSSAENNPSVQNNQNN